MRINLYSIKFTFNNVMFSKNSLDKKEIINIIGLTILAFVIRIFFLQFQQFITHDGAEYAVLGKNLIAGNGYMSIQGQINLFFSPLYPLLIGIFSLVFENLELSARLVSILFGSLLIIPLYFFSRKIYNQKVAIISSLLVALYWVLIRYSTATMTESTYTFLLMCSALLVYTALINQTKVLFILSGIFLGLSYLTRPDAIGYLFIFMVLTLIYFKRDNGQRYEWKKALACCLIMFICFVAILSPYILFFHEQTGKWTLGNRGIINTIYGEDTSDVLNFEKNVFGLTEDGKEIKILMTQNSSILEYVISDPVGIAKRYIQNSEEQYIRYITSIFPPLLIMLAGVGLFRKNWTRERLKKELFIAVIIAYPLLIYPLFHLDSRYIAPILPLAIIWAANGINELQTWLDTNLNNNAKGRFRQGFLLKNIVLIVAILSLIPMMITIYHSNYPVEHKEAGLWLGENSPGDSIILSRDPWVSFYSERIWLPLPYANYSQLLYYAKYHKATHIIIDRRIVELRPELAFLMDKNEANSNDLRLIYENGKHNILVYEILYN